MQLDIMSSVLSFLSYILSMERRYVGQAGAKALRVNNRLKVLRAERDWSQADLAERLAVSRQTIKSIETGNTYPTPPLAIRIGKLFARPVD
jgi:putative transcriptional regulator